MISRPSPVVITTDPVAEPAWALADHPPTCTGSAGTSRMPPVTPTGTTAACTCSAGIASKAGAAGSTRAGVGVREARPAS